MTGSADKAHPALPLTALPLTAFASASIAILGIIAMWTLAVPIGPEVCALTMPPPRNCFVQDRALAAGYGTVVVGLLGAGAIAAAVLARAKGKRVVAITGPVVVAVAAAGAYLSAAWIPV